ncbi:hypothetical protein [Streptomyces sp. NPDC051577]|uniref:hypothetical protein n=1 Tax=Streptomyces sp. NPDC051577 TaxID=3155166 RepID=UPI003433437F
MTDPRRPCARCNQPITAADASVREWTGPADIPARAWHADCEPCAGCGGGPVIYRNFNQHPLCAHCCECSCGKQPCAKPPHAVDTAGSPDRRASIRHLLNRASRGALTPAEAELLRVQVEAEQRDADQRTEQADAVTAQTKRLMDRRTTTLRKRAERAETLLVQAEQNRLGDQETISYWATATLTARDNSRSDSHAREAAIGQARRWAARARTAEATIARARKVEEEWRLHFLATGETPGGHALVMVRAALDETQEPRP